jgi:hypothetical protein
MLIHETRTKGPAGDTGINDGDFNWHSASDIPSKVHNNGTTVVYTDTHASWKSYDQLMKARDTLLWKPYPSEY